MAALKSSSVLYALMVFMFTLGIIFSADTLPKRDQIQHINLNTSLLSNLEDDELEQALPNNQDISQVFNKALNMARLQNFEEAIIGYQDILKHHPNHQMAVINLAILIKKTQGCEASQPLMEHAVQISRGKRKAKSHALLANCLLEFNEYALAIKHLEQSIQFRPNHSKTWLALAQAQSEINTPYSTALGSYQKALALDSNNKRTRLNMASYQFKHLDFNGSINTLKKKYKTFKTSIGANKLMALNYLNLSKFNNAKKYAGRVKALQNSDSIYSQAFELYLSKQTDMAIDAIKAIPTKRAENRYLLALAYQQKNWIKHAKSQLIKLNTSQQFSFISQWRLIQVTPKETPTKNKISKYQSLLGKNIHTPLLAFEAAQYAKKSAHIDNAFKFILMARHERPLHKKSDRLYAELLWLKGDKQLAIDHLTLLNQHFVKSRLIKRQLAGYLNNQHKTQLALKLISQIHPSDLKSIDLVFIAKLFEKERQYKPAIKQLNELIARDNTHTQGRYMLARLLKKTGKLQASTKQLTQLLKLDPNYQPALHLLAELK